MRTVKNDRRVKYTQTIIKETFLSLLEKKELSKIMVMEICTLADINRATFYTHYLDTHHLYHSIEEAFYDEITKLLNALQNGPNDPNAISNVEKILNYLKDNKELTRLLLSDRGDLSFQKRVMKLIHHSITNPMINFPNLSKDEAEYIYAHAISGSLGLVQKWLDDNMTQDQYFIANMIIQLNLALVEGMKRQKNISLSA